PDDLDRAIRGQVARRGEDRLDPGICRDRAESYLVAHAQPDRWIGGWIEELLRRSSDQVPAARCRQCIDACLLPANPDRTGRHSQTWTVAPWCRQLLWQPGKVGEARSEAEGANGVGGASMPGDHLFNGQAGMRRNAGKIFPKIIPVNDRNGVDTRFRVEFHVLQMFPPK